jgi:hypothetical protein
MYGGFNVNELMEVVVTKRVRKEFVDTARNASARANTGKK